MFKSEKSKKIISGAVFIAVFCLTIAFIGYNTSLKQKKISGLKLEIVKTALEKYNVEKKQYPEALVALKTGKYLNAEDLLDFWGSEYIYVPCYKEEGKKKIVITYMLSSAGKDKKNWTKDDVQ